MCIYLRGLPGTCCILGSCPVLCCSEKELASLASWKKLDLANISQQLAIKMGFGLEGSPVHRADATHPPHMTPLQARADVEVQQHLCYSHDMASFKEPHGSCNYSFTPFESCIVKHLKVSRCRWILNRVALDTYKLASFVS